MSVKPTEQSAATMWKLTCDPVGGDHPDAQAACAALAKAKSQANDPFAATPKDHMCTQIYGGSEVAMVQGTWQGKKINAAFSRKNGCEIKRWSDLAPLFGKVSMMR